MSKVLAETKRASQPALPSQHAEWDIVPLGDIFTFANGVNAPKQAYGKGYPFVNVLEVITTSHLRGHDIQGRVALSESTAKPFFVREGDVLFNRTSEIEAEVGLASVYRGCAEVVYGGFVIRGRPITNSLDTTYAGYALRAAAVRAQIIPMGQGAIRSNIGQESLKQVKVPLPPLQEQQAIGRVLSDVDGLLTSLDQLIAKKRDLKQAAMQQLLSGNTRLPGFRQKWEHIALGDLFTFKNGLNKAKQFFGHGTPIVNYMDVFSNPRVFGSNLAGRVSLTKQELCIFDVKAGDVLFTRTSETPEEIGISAVVLDEPLDTVFSGFLLRGRPVSSQLNNEFKVYCFSSAYVRAQIVSKASYTTRALTNGTILSAVMLPVPPIAEQEAIAKALSEMDAELTALEFRRAKTLALKQAMMQELLTGRIRLV